MPRKSPKEEALPNLGDGMRRLNGAYGTYFNRRYGRSGHVFKRPFGSERIMDDPQLATAVAYVAGNPVTARPCATPRTGAGAATAVAPMSIERC
jgi:hypothetical protein